MAGLFGGKKEPGASCVHVTRILSCPVKETRQDAALLDALREEITLYSNEVDRKDHLWSLDRAQGTRHTCSARLWTDLHSQECLSVQDQMRKQL